MICSCIRLRYAKKMQNNLIKFGCCPITIKCMEFVSLYFPTLMIPNSTEGFANSKLALCNGLPRPH